jgi:hypothetical protein
MKRAGITLELNGSAVSPRRSRKSEKHVEEDERQSEAGPQAGKAQEY